MISLQYSRSLDCSSSHGQPRLICTDVSCNHPITQPCASGRLFAVWLHDNTWARTIFSASGGQTLYQNWGNQQFWQAILYYVQVSQAGLYIYTKYNTQHSHCAETSRSLVCCSLLRCLISSLWLEEWIGNTRTHCENDAGSYYKLYYRAFSQRRKCKAMFLN